MPRGIGASTGVNDTGPGLVAPGLAERLLDLRRMPVRAADLVGRRPSPSPRWPAGRPAATGPAPEVPEAATTTTSAGSARPAATSGASARIAAVA